MTVRLMRPFLLWRAPPSTTHLARIGVVTPPRSPTCNGALLAAGTGLYSICSICSNDISVIYSKSLRRATNVRVDLE